MSNIKKYIYNYIFQRKENLYKKKITKINL